MLQPLSARDDARVARVEMNERFLDVWLEDGRRISSPMIWYPRLLAARCAERDGWHIDVNGRDIHWPEIHQTISLDTLLSGRQAA